jgi:flagellar secretion chaperone FliS
MSPAMNPYANQAVQTASPARLVTMLYDRILTAFARSRTALAEPVPSYATANHELQRAQDILDELRHTLDHTAGGEIATNLDALYAYCSERVLAANLRKDPTGIDDAEAIITDIRSAWVTSCDTALAAVGV